MSTKTRHQPFPTPQARGAWFRLGSMLLASLFVSVARGQGGSTFKNVKSDLTADTGLDDWSARDGASVAASFVGAQNNSITLELYDGSLVAIPYSSLTSQSKNLALIRAKEKGIRQGYSQKFLEYRSRLSQRRDIAVDNIRRLNAGKIHVYQIAAPPVTPNYFELGRVRQPTPPAYSARRQVRTFVWRDGSPDYSHSESSYE